MIQSKLKVWGIIAIVISIGLFAVSTFMVYALTSVFFFEGKILERGMQSQTEAVFAILMFAFWAFIVLFAWRKFFFIIEINPNDKSIFFKNIFTRKIFKYHFEELDGYMDIYARTRNGNYKVLYLIKDKKAVRTITGYYYSNIDEIEDALCSIHYYGQATNWRRISRKALFGRPVIS